jgi:hypothetical protein
MLCDKYYSLKDEIKAVEKLQRGVEKIVEEIPIEKQRKPERNRSKGMEL